MTDNISSAFMHMINPTQYSEDNVNIEACANCAQEHNICCKCLPCYIAPEDVKDKTLQGLINLINTNVVSLDWYVGDPREEGFKEKFTDKTNIFHDKTIDDKYFFLRARAKDKPIVHPALFQCECIFLTDIGCMLPYCYRPKGGRELLPPHCKNNPTDKCRDNYSKQQCAIDWIPYRDTLIELYQYCIDNKKDKATDKDSETEKNLDTIIDLFSALSQYSGTQQEGEIDENKEDH